MEDIKELFELVPEDEIRGRISRFQERMVARGVDFSLILQNVDIFYFTGTLQKGYLCIPADREPLFLVQRDWRRAQQESPLNIEKMGSIKELLSFITSMGLSEKQRVGLELDVLPVTLFLRLQGFLGERDFVDVSADVLRCRARKSPFEIEQIKKSGKIVEHVLSTVREHCREGMAEVELDALLQAEGRKAGHQGWLRMRGLNQEMSNICLLAGKSAAFPSFGDTPLRGYGATHAIAQGASHRKIGRNEPIIIDYGGGYNGYTTDETRTFVIGRLDEEFERAYEVACRILQFCEDHAREGVNGRELYQQSVDIVSKYGLEEYFMGYGDGKVKFIGHGLGLEINEIPVIADGRDEILEEGMVFAFEPKFVFPDQGAVAVEVDYIVRKDGVERTAGFPTDIVYL